MKEVGHQEISNRQIVPYAQTYYPTIPSIIFSIWEPTIFALSFNLPWIELLYVLFRAVPGLGANLNTLFLLFSLIATSSFAVIKLVEKAFKWPFLQRTNRYLAGLDTFPATLVFNLQALGAAIQYVASQDNDNQYTEVDAPGWAIALLVLFFAGISVFVTLHALDKYSDWQRKFSSNRVLSTILKVGNILTSFGLNVILFNAIGRSTIELVTTFELGGIEEEEDPRNWYLRQILPTSLVAIFLGGLVAYIQFGKKAVRYLANYYERRHNNLVAHHQSNSIVLHHQEHEENAQEFIDVIVEYFRKYGTAYAINAGYWVTVQKIRHNLEEARTNNGFVYSSVAMMLVLIGVPLALTALLILYLTFSSVVGIKNIILRENQNVPRFSSALQEPLIESTENNKEMRVIALEEQQVVSAEPRRSSWLPRWLSFLPGCEQPQQSTISFEDPTSTTSPSTNV